MSDRAGEGVTRNTDWKILASLVAFVIVLCIPRPPELPPPAHRLAAVTILMATLWLTSALPIAVTSLIPLVLFPLLGIQSSAVVSKSYIDQNVFLYLGGFMIALGIEKWGLHRRMALHIVSVIGSAPRRIVLGFMVATAFLSMWISNTASTLLMMPIGLAMLATGSDQGAGESNDGTDSQRHLDRIGVVLLLGIAYSASIGGLMTLVGTPTNVAFIGIWQRQFPGGPEISAGQWMLTWIPLGTAMLGLSWFILTWPLRGMPSDQFLTRSYVRDRLRSLGPATRPEKMMLILFVTTALLWTFRKPLQFGDEPLLPGWQQAVESFLLWIGTEPELARSACHDSTVAIGMAVLMFALPARRNPSGEVERLMDWESTSGLPWAILLLIGGGFAIAAAFSETGLATWTGIELARALDGMPTWMLVASVCLLLTFLTEFTSNVATVTTLVPILAGAAVQLGFDPRLIMVPAVISASCAFMLPIATPPNAIIFSSGRIRIGQMARYGVLLNLCGVALVTLASLWLMKPQWNVATDALPDWAATSEAVLE